MIKQHERPKMLVDRALFFTRELLDLGASTNHLSITEYKAARPFKEKVPNLVALMNADFSSAG